MRVPAFLLWKKPAEHSVPFRAATLSSVMCGILAILHEQQWPDFGWIVVVATLIGFSLSHLRRESTNWVLKIFLSFFMLFALYDFLQNLIYNPYDPRVPLANLLLWLQTLHSFDLPARRDLNYSLLTGFILVSVAGVLSHDMSYVPFLAAFLLCALLTMHYNYLSQASEDAQPASLMPSFGVLARNVAQLSVLLVVVSAATYFFIPRYEGMRIRPMPMAFKMKFPNNLKGEIRNPSYPSMSGNLRNQQRKFDPDNYFGFSSYLDLNLRGHLSDDVVMRVRSSEWAYYRGLAFNHYNGDGWEITNEALQRVTSPSPPIWIEGAPPGDREIVQIYYVEKDLPNVIFAAYHLNQLFWVSDTIYIDAHSGVRATYPLETGLVYSAISVYRAPSPEKLRRLSARRRQHLSEWYRQAAALNLNLPDSLPTRVRDLAKQITRKDGDPYHKALAIDLYLQQHYHYTQEIPPFPKGSDVADQFLFEFRRGYCEQFATSMTVLCRCEGIPARLVTGYAPGTYNPFTGFYEVKGSDAHAWVEAFIDGFGWLQFDPSPGYEASPQIEKKERSRWVMTPFLDYLENQLGSGLTSVMKSVLEWVAQFAGINPHTMKVILYVTSFALSWFVALALIGHAFSDRKHQKSSPMRLAAPGWAQAVRSLAQRLLAPRPKPTLEGEVFTAYRNMLDELARRGCTRQPWQTPREFATAAMQALPQARNPIENLTGQYIIARYSGRPATPEWTETAQRTLHELQECFKEKRP